MRKLILLMHTSIDGYVAGPNGEMDWIRVDDDLFNEVGKFTDEADTALYGRVTYQMMEAYWPTAGDQPNASKHDIEHSRWTKNATKIVVSRQLTSTTWEKSVIMGENFTRQIRDYKKQEGKDILLIGSPSIVPPLMQEGLIDNYRIYVNPIVLGTGIPLFKNIGQAINLRVESVKSFPSGVIGLHYVL